MNKWCPWQQSVWINQQESCPSPLSSEVISLLLTVFSYLLSWNCSQINLQHLAPPYTPKKPCPLFQTHPETFSCITACIHCIRLRGPYCKYPGEVAQLLRNLIKASVFLTCTFIMVHQMESASPFPPGCKFQYCLHLRLKNDCLNYFFLLEQTDFRNQNHQLMSL